MDYTVLGRTGLTVSVMGLGCGGPSRLGQSTGSSEAESVRLVRAALDCGVNILDTAESYRTEAIIGKALRDVRREDVIISTKKSPWADHKPVRAEDIRAGLEASLSRLRTDYVDIYHLHGVGPRLYPRAREEMAPALLKLRDEGKIRFPGITEEFDGDPTHAMLQQALQDDCWDVVMVGFNLLNQTARKTVFPAAIAGGVGTLIMFAVRRAFSRPERLRKIIRDLKERGSIDEGALDEDEPLGFLIREDGAGSLPDAAYRFCRHEPGADVVLSGTGSVAHLRANAESMTRPDLPAADRARLESIFARVDDVSGS